MYKLTLALPCMLLIALANIIIKSRIDYFARDTKLLSIGSFSLLLRDPLFYLGGILVLISVAWWIFVSPTLDVSVFYPILQAGVIISTLVLSVLFLGEQLSTFKLLSAVVLIIGIFMLSIS